uniref:Ataxin 1-like n=1 Tax=Neogobius melanostomus TaxID=47308 RepID=A0A8C6T056_9GOBI
MKPAQERNQECLPPKKRDLLVTNSGAGVTEDEVVSFQNSAANTQAQGGAKSGEWLRAQPALHYSAESSDSIPAVPIDHYSMLYKVALPSVTYSQSSLHPVLSHISPAYTVHSPLLQHPGLPYPHPLGYAQIPHSSLQFVSSPYALPYALPPGFVPGSLVSPPGSLPQSHAVSHLVPYPSVVQEGVVSPPPQPQVAAHTFAKVPASGVSLMLPSEQAPQQHLGSILPGAELGSRGIQGSTSPTINIQLLAQEHSQIKPLHSCRPGDWGSQSQRSTPDSDLEVQQVVSRFVSNVGRKEVSFAPLNLSQSTPRSKDVHVESTEGVCGRGLHPAQSVSDSRMCSVQQQPVPSGHAVVMANGQPVLIPLEYTAQHPSNTLQQQYPAQVNNDMPNHCFKASDSSAKVCLSERSAGESNTAHKPPAQPIAHVNKAPVTSSTPSHFMKGAIIQLATGELKRVEDLQTQDFVRSAELSGGLKIDSSMVVNIHASQQRPGLVSLHFTVGEQQSKVTIDVPPEHPFFVFGQGWSSCSPERTAQLYGLPSHHLQVGDVCFVGNIDPSVRASSLRRWSSPSLQRFSVKGDDNPQPPMNTARPSFIPQEVKLSIEGRSNAGK